MSRWRSSQGLTDGRSQLWDLKGVQAEGTRAKALRLEEVVRWKEGQPPRGRGREGPSTGRQAQGGGESVQDLKAVLLTVLYTGSGVGQTRPLTL